MQKCNLNYTTRALTVGWSDIALFRKRGHYAAYQVFFFLVQLKEIGEFGRARGKVFIFKNRRDPLISPACDCYLCMCVLSVTQFYVAFLLHKSVICVTQDGDAGAIRSPAVS